MAAPTLVAFPWNGEVRLLPGGVSGSCPEAADTGPDSDLRELCTVPAQFCLRDAVVKHMPWGAAAVQDLNSNLMLR